MKTSTHVSDLTHDDLVNLFCTATYGSEWLDIKVPKGSYQGTELEDANDCREDKWAKVLLNGKGKIYAFDYYADEVGYGKLPHKVINSNGTVRYELSLKDIKKGLSLAADYEGEASGYIRDCFRKFQTDDNSFDQVVAENLMQIILFGELIYG